MTAFNPSVDAAAVAFGPLFVEPTSLAEQFYGLNWPAPHFSNAFRAWCTYGRSTTGRTEDGRTWVVVGDETPRAGAPVRVRRCPPALRKRHLPLRKSTSGDAHVNYCAMGILMIFFWMA